MKIPNSIYYQYRKKGKKKSNLIHGNIDLFYCIRTYDEIKKEIRQYFGFESVRVAFGIDFSASNEWQGRKTFNGQLLHKTNSNKIFNPYQKVR